MAHELGDPSGVIVGCRRIILRFIVGVGIGDPLLLRRFDHLCKILVTGHDIVKIPGGTGVDEAVPSYIGVLPDVQIVRGVVSGGILLQQPHLGEGLQVDIVQQLLVISVIGDGCIRLCHKVTNVGKTLIIFRITAQPLGLFYSDMLDGPGSKL